MKGTTRTVLGAAVLGLALHCGCRLTNQVGQAGGDSNKSATSLVHYLSGEVVVIDRGRSLLEVREGVQVHHGDIKELRLKASTAVSKAGKPMSLRQVRQGDYVLIKYSVDPSGIADADEIRLASKGEHGPSSP